MELPSSEKGRTWEEQVHLDPAVPEGILGFSGKRERVLGLGELEGEKGK